MEVRANTIAVYSRQALEGMGRGARSQRAGLTSMRLCTIIAPEADVVLPAGMQPRDSVIANSITGKGTLRNYPLAEDVQPP